MIKTTGSQTWSVNENGATFNLNGGESINLVAVGGSNDVVMPNWKITPLPPGTPLPTSETFHLTSIYSNVRFISGWGNQYSGNIQVHGGKVDMFGLNWQATGVNRVDAGAQVTVEVADPGVVNIAGMTGTAIFQISGRSTMEFYYSPHAQLNLYDATLKLDQSWDQQSISMQSRGGKIDVGGGDFHPLASASYYDIKGDLLIFHDPTTAELGRIAVQNHSGQALQVDVHTGNGYGLEIVADSIPRPGMIAHT